MKQDLIEALKRLARGHVDAAEAVADLLMPDEPTFDVTLPTDKLIEAVEADTAKKKRAK